MSSHEAARRKANPREFVKRALDVAISVLAIVVLTPVFMVVWIAAIHLDSPGPAVFRQRRIGRDEKSFTCFKFRTLRHNADENVHREAIRRVWAKEPLSNDPDAPYKLTDDPRVTRVGRFLRKFSLDELPQLFNVLKGDMSLVGPRPVPTYEVAGYSPRHHNRFAALPGITGWWQVKGRCQVSFEEMIRMDLDYIRNASLWLDLKILFLTLPAVLSRRGAE